MRMQAFTQSLASGIMPVAAQFGVSLQSLGAALAYMTDRGVPADEATTRLRMSLSLMAAPSHLAAKLLTDAGLGASEASYRVNAMTDALHQSGVSVVALADDLKKPDGIVVALRDLKTHMDAAGVSAEMQNAVLSRAFGGGRSGGTIMALYANLDGVAQKFDQLGASAGAFGGAWAQQSQTFDQRVKDAEASAKALAITWGTALLPAATDLMTFLTHVAQDLGGTGDAAAKADKPAQDFANALRDIGNVGGTVMGVLGHIGQWMLDNHTMVEGIALAFAGWKVEQGAWSLLQKLPGIGSSGATSGIFGAAGSKLAPQDVFVVNWAMMGGGGLLGAGEKGVGAGVMRFLPGMAPAATSAAAAETITALGGTALIASLALGTLAGLGVVGGIWGVTNLIYGDHPPPNAEDPKNPFHPTSGGRGAGFVNTQRGLNDRRNSYALGQNPDTHDAEQADFLALTKFHDMGQDQINLFYAKWKDINASSSNVDDRLAALRMLLGLTDGPTSSTVAHLHDIAKNAQGVAGKTANLDDASAKAVFNLQDAVPQLIDTNTNVHNLQRHTLIASEIAAGMGQDISDLRDKLRGAAAHVGDLAGNFGNAPSVPGAPRATGGPVQVGRSYLVGEHAPELFTPGTDGYITPNGMLGAGGGQQSDNSVHLSIGSLVLQGVQDVPALFAQLREYGLSFQRSTGTSLWS
jgi:TP901 family phage tail tape measure protein